MACACPRIVGISASAAARLWLWATCRAAPRVSLTLPASSSRPASWTPHPLRCRAHRLGPLCLAIRLARGDDGGDRQLWLWLRPRPPGGPGAGDAADGAHRDYPALHYAGLDALGLGDVSGVSGQFGARRDWSKCSVAGGLLSTARLGDGQRGGA